MTAPPLAVSARGLSHVHPGSERPALAELDLSIVRGERVAVLGPSGSGKSTLLSLIGGLRRPQRGSLVVEGQSMSAASERELLALRARHVAYVLQQPGRNLLPYASVAANVAFALRPHAVRAPGTERATAALLDRVGLRGARSARAGSLSGGEQQRLAVALAVARGPSLLLADEPTSQLDHASAHTLVQVLGELVQDTSMTVIVVTHDPEVADVFPRQFEIRDGRLE